MQLDVDCSVLQRVILDALQGADATFIEPYLHVLVVFLAAKQPELRQAAWACLSKAYFFKLINIDVESSVLYDIIMYDIYSYILH